MSGGFGQAKPAGIGAGGGGATCWAMSAAMSPVRTSPVPAVARQGWSVLFVHVRRPSETTVFLPLSTMMHPSLAASCWHAAARASSVLSAWSAVWLFWPRDAARRLNSPG